VVRLEIRAKEKGVEGSKSLDTFSQTSVSCSLVEIVWTVVDAIFVVPQGQAGGVPSGEHHDFLFRTWLGSRRIVGLDTKCFEIDLWVGFNRADHVAIEIIHAKLSI